MEFKKDFLIKLIPLSYLIYFIVIFLMNGRFFLLVLFLGLLVGIVLNSNLARKIIILVVVFNMTVVIFHFFPLINEELVPMSDDKRLPNLVFYEIGLFFILLSLKSKYKGFALEEKIVDRILNRNQKLGN